ncbi:MAG: stage V sporulation protein AD [Bacillota bacterium]|nr:stage V sporulation protein AD [Bacillota bacterium]
MQTYAEKKIGRQSVILEKDIMLVSAAAVAGPKESLGPLSDAFDRHYSDTILKEKSFERAERHMLEEACHLAVGKAGIYPEDIDYFIAGDLLNQVITASFCARGLAIPYLGIYGACSTLAEGLSLGTMIIEGGFAKHILIATSSHNSGAERQYRYPTEYGYQRPGYAQWTVTGAGAVVLGAAGEGPRVESITTGKVVDAGIKDPFDLGVAMAPAAADTIYNHFLDLEREPSYYNLILTGDLGGIGMKLNEDILASKGFNIQHNYADCGTLLYYPHQKVDAGASGCASSALVFLGHFYKQMMKKELRKVLLVATGALHSPTTFCQQETIPGIAHAVSLEI